MITQYCCANIFSCTPAVTDSPAGTGMNNAFLLIIILFLNETTIITIHRSKKYDQTQNAMRTAAKTSSSANSTLHNFWRRRDDAVIQLYS